MKIAAITTAGLALANFAAAATHCTQGLNYCGDTLLYVDPEFYRPRIHALGDTNILLNFLFRCNANGEISFIDQCHAYGCVNGGVGKSDYCATSF